MSIPHISIAYNRFLDPIFIAWIRSQDRYTDWKQPSRDSVLRHVKKYNQIWDTHGTKILRSLEKCTGMKFHRTLIPVYVVSGNPRAFSDPLVITSRYDGSDFLDTLTHELIHCLFVDNGISAQAVRKVFPHEDETVSAHIPVYAILEHVFKDVLKIGYDHLQRCDDSKINLAYKNSIRIVRSRGYKAILKTIKKDLIKNTG
jgi:hypothetical protein